MEVLCAGEGVSSGVGVFTGGSRNGRARLSTRKGKNQMGGGWRGKLRHVASHRSGWEENVGRQKLAVAWMMLSSRGRRQGGMSRGYWSRSMSSSRLCGRRAESRVGERAPFGREGEVLWTNCARAGSRLVQVSSIGWSRSLMVMLADSWWWSCCFFRPF